MKSSRKKTRKFLLQKLYARIYAEVSEEPFHDAFFGRVFKIRIFLDTIGHRVAGDYTGGHGAFLGVFLNAERLCKTPTNPLAWSKSISRSTVFQKISQH